MKERTGLFALVLVVLVGVVLLIPISSALAQKKPIVLRLVVPFPPGDWPLTAMNEDIAKRFNARAKGEYKIEVFAGGALAKLPEYFDAIRIGAVEMACSPWVLYSFLDPRLGALELPFLFNNNDAANQGVADCFPLYDKILQEKFNAKGLGVFNTGGLELWANDTPVKTLEDWKGFLVAAISPTVSTMANYLNASPVTIMWPDMYESLQKGVVNGAIHSTHGGLIMSLADVCKHATLFFGIDGSNGFSMNLDVWGKMPPNIQKILQDEVNAGIAWYRKILPKMNEDDIMAMMEKGVDVHHLPAKERERWVNALAPYRDEQLSIFGEFGTKIKLIADEANTKYPYKNRPEAH